MAKCGHIFYFLTHSIDFSIKVRQDIETKEQHYDSRQTFD